MTRLLHISDLHFGTERPGLAAALVEQAREWAPDLTVISGDLTQRALAGQFRQTAALIADLPGPVLSVPGNHDMPLWNVFARLFTPFAAWRRHIGPDLNPMVDVAGMRLIGLNTADPYAWEAGRLRGDVMARVLHRLQGAGAGQLRIVAMHHPLRQPPQSDKSPMPGAEAASHALAGAGADLVLCGHLHAWATSAHAERKGGRAVLIVQAGTTLSTRLRGSENDLNLIDWDKRCVTITRMVAAGQLLRFERAEVSAFHQPDPQRGWVPAPDGMRAAAGTALPDAAMSDTPLAYPAPRRAGGG